MVDRFNQFIEQLNKFMVKHTHSNREILNYCSKDLILGGGKRLRPILLQLSARFGGNYDSDKILKLASGIELLHMATLVHDDVIDEAKLRRGRATAQIKFGEKVAIFVGDYLLSKAYTLFSQNMTKQTLDRLNDTVKLICEGEIDQFNDKFNYRLSINDYFRRIRRKTALLFGISTYTGAYESGVRGKTLYNLYNFGIELGMAFQIQDDLLDFTGLERKAGKQLGQDIASGIYTLPIILLLKDRKYSERLFKLLDEDKLNENQICEITSLTDESGVLDESRNFGERFLRKAIYHLNHLPDRDNLKDDLQYIINIQLSREN